MSSRVGIVTPPGMFGASESDGLLDAALRSIARRCESDPDVWADKYGVLFENDVFSMRPECWCDMDDGEECPRCGVVGGRDDVEPKPNFHYKPTNLKVWWYKWIGRGMEWNYAPSEAEIIDLTARCLKSVEVKDDR